MKSAKLQRPLIIFSRPAFSQERFGIVFLRALAKRHLARTLSQALWTGGWQPGRPSRRLPARLRFTGAACILGAVEREELKNVRSRVAKTTSQVIGLIDDEADAWIAAGFRSIAPLFAA